MSQNAHFRVATPAHHESMYIFPSLGRHKKLQIVWKKLRCLKATEVMFGGQYETGMRSTGKEGHGLSL